MDTEKERIKVLMLPWLAHGHISPFLELAKRLVDKNFHIFICSTPINLSSIKNKIPQNYSLSIQLVELHLPSLPDLPAHNHTTNGLPLNLHSTLRKALKLGKPDFSNLLKTLQPDLVIHDIIIPWAGAVSMKNNIPTVVFFTSGAAMFSYFAHLGRNPGIQYPFPEIRLTDFELSIACKTMESAQNEMNEEKDPDDEIPQNEDGIILINSSREMEGKYMDYLSKSINRKIMPVGASVQDPSVQVHDGDVQIMDWLGRKEEFSTVFVSFGSEYFLEKEEMQEVAYGLELSNVNFIWIIRFAKGEEKKISEALPKGFLDRIGERGKIVEKWAPQTKILTHPSVGGFVSHCGWNSVIESIEYGVPIIAMPMHLDQPMNAKLTVQLGVGVEVKRDGKGNILREEIAKVIHDVIFDKTGAILRRRIVEQGDKIRSTSRDEMEVVANKLAIISGRRLSDTST